MDDLFPDGALSEIGRGRTTFLIEMPVVGRVRWLETDRDVFHMISDGDVEETIVICRGETGSLLTAAIDAGVKAVLTLQGEEGGPLGMLSHEKGTPYVLDVAFSSDTDKVPMLLPANGDLIVLDFSCAPFVAVHSPSAISQLERDTVRTSQVLRDKELRERNYQGCIPGGAPGDRMIRQSQKSRILYLDASSLHRMPTVEEFNDWSRYAGWNVWDLLARPLAPGMHKWLPTYKHAGINNLHAWQSYPKLIRIITDKLGPDGVIGLGRQARHEIGTKINPQHLWLLLFSVAFGRGVSIELGLASGADRKQDILETLQFCRRVCFGMFGGGEMYASMRNYEIPLAAPALLKKFHDERVMLHLQEERDVVSRLSTLCNLMSTLVHADSGCGVSSSGPYKGAGGEKIIISDYFFQPEPMTRRGQHEVPPYSISLVMYFSSSSTASFQLADLASGDIPVDPANGLVAIGVYVKDAWNAGINDEKPLSMDQVDELVHRLAAIMAQIKSWLSRLPERERKADSDYERVAELIMPFARAAGVEDSILDFIKESYQAGLTETGPIALKHFDLANAILPRLVLSGAGYPEMPFN